MIFLGTFFRYNTWCEIELSYSKETQSAISLLKDLLCLWCLHAHTERLGGRDSTDCPLRSSRHQWPVVLAVSPQQKGISLSSSRRRQWYLAALWKSKNIKYTRMHAHMLDTHHGASRCEVKGELLSLSSLVTLPDIHAAAPSWEYRNNTHWRQNKSSGKRLKVQTATLAMFSNLMIRFPPLLVISFMQKFLRMPKNISHTKFNTLYAPFWV